jgi:glycine/D-amino acid oxidase-like deaminating enzyme
MVDLDLPLQVSLEEEVLLVPPPGEPPPQITVSDMAKAIYYRADSHRVLVGRGYPKEYQYVDPDCSQDGVNPDFIAETRRRMVERIPVYRDALVQHSYSGLYDITPDWHPVLGRTLVEGYYVAAGFSGHGFKLGPAIGELLAEEIVDGRAKDIDLGEFSLNRFKQGRPFAAAYGGNRA